MTPHEQLIQAKAKELLEALEDNFNTSEAESFLTSFAAQIGNDTREEDAKICEGLAKEHKEQANSGGGDEYCYGQADCYQSQIDAAGLIRSKITKI